MESSQLKLACGTGCTKNTETNPILQNMTKDAKARREEKRMPVNVHLRNVLRHITPGNIPGLEPSTVAITLPCQTCCGCWLILRVFQSDGAQDDGEFRQGREAICKEVGRGDEETLYTSCTAIANVDDVLFVLARTRD